MASYIETMDDKGNAHLAGPYTHWQAQQIVDKNKDSNAKIWDFPTRDRAKATRMWKEKKYEDGKFEKAFSRVGHKLIQEEK